LSEKATHAVREMTVEDWLGADNTIGIDIWNKKYRYGDETFVHWLDRVSGGNASVKHLILEKKFLFGGRILANRGISGECKKITMSNCYVIEPPEDNLESIFDCAKKLARTYSYGGGCGVDLSKLSPSGMKVRNAAKESSGAVSFMDLYSMVTGLISQNGRRGALMLSLKIDHPDIEEFIDIKKDLDRVTKANISIRITKEFMDAVIDDRPFKMTFTREETGDTVEKIVQARELFNKVAENNWDMGEPGMLFWDRIENWNFLSEYDNFKYSGVNPCAEEPLPAGGSCLLGSINLAEFVDEFGNLDFDSLADATFTATMALNEVLDEGLPLHPLQEQRDSVRDWRQIGLGIFGYADMLIKMGVTYGSEEALELTEHIARHILNYATQASTTLAYTKGPFPMYNHDKLIKSKFYDQNIDQWVKDYVDKYGLRNSQIITIPPTGTLSTMIGVSGGVEPIFANYYTRKTESLHGENVEYKVYTPIVKEYMDKNGLTDDSQLPDYFVTSSDIKPIDRVKTQSVWQQYVDASISSTVNLPEGATVDDVAKIYIDAYKYGLKGITVFRSGCRRAGILTTSSSKPNEDTVDAPEVHNEDTLPRGYILDASDNLVGKKRKLMTGCGSLHCTAFFDPITGDLMETYLSRGSTGGCANSYTGLSRMISLAARAGVGIDAIIDQLNSCGVCPSYAVRHATKHDTSPGACCPIAIGKALKDMWEEMQSEIAFDDDTEPLESVEERLFDDPMVMISYPVQKIDLTKSITTYTCPECGAEVIHEGGCDICKNCGWSRCS